MDNDGDEIALPPFLSFDTWKKLLAPLLITVTFIACFFVFLVLTAFEMLSAWSAAGLYFNETYPFYEVKGLGSNILMLLIVFQFIWGMSFLKESCKCQVTQLTSSSAATGPSATAITVVRREATTAMSVNRLPIGRSSSCSSCTTGAALSVVLSC